MSSRRNQAAPALVINLDRSRDRLKRFSEQAAVAGLAFERLAAVDGLRLSPEEIAAHLGPGRAGPREEATKLGCILSHRRAWERAIELGAAWTAIFEDDVHLSAESASFLADLDWVPGDADLLKLETFLHSAEVSMFSRPAKDGRRLRRLAGLHAGSAGYLISAPTATRLLASKVSDSAADVFLFGTSVPPSSGLTIYQLTPALCVQETRLAAWEGRPSRDEATIFRRSIKRGVLRRIRREIDRHLHLAAALASLRNPRAKIPFR